jgi:hypothetical protein
MFPVVPAGRRLSELSVMKRLALAFAVSSAIGSQSQAQTFFQYDPNTGFGSAWSVPTPPTLNLGPLTDPLPEPPPPPLPRIPRNEAADGRARVIVARLGQGAAMCERGMLDRTLCATIEEAHQTCVLQGNPTLFEGAACIVEYVGERGLARIAKTTLKPSQRRTPES